MSTTKTTAPKLPAKVSSEMMAMLKSATETLANARDAAQKAQVAAIQAEGAYNQIATTIRDSYQMDPAKDVLEMDGTIKRGALAVGA